MCPPKVLDFSYYKMADLLHIPVLNKATAEVILQLKRHCSTHLIPEKFISNYMPLSSHEFGEFAKLYEFEKASCSPEYSQSNGKAGISVKAIRLVIKKAKDAKTDFYLAHLQWRNTLSAGIDSSPAQRMFGRRMTTLLPMSKQLLQLETQKRVSEKLKVQNQLQSEYFNRGSKELSEQQKHDAVRKQSSKQDRAGGWRKGIVLRKVDVRSYIVRSEDGTVLRRNRKSFRASKEPFDYIAEDVTHIPCPQNKEKAPGIESKSQSETEDKADHPKHSKLKKYILL